MDFLILLPLFSIITRSPKVIVEMLMLCSWYSTSCLCPVNGFAGSPGSSMGKTVASKSPSPPPPAPPIPSGNIAVCPGQKTDLRVVVPQSKGMMQTLVSLSYRRFTWCKTGLFWLISVTGSRSCQLGKEMTGWQEELNNPALTFGWFKSQGSHSQGCLLYYVM